MDSGQVADEGKNEVGLKSQVGTEQQEEKEEKGTLSSW